MYCREATIVCRVTTFETKAFSLGKSKSGVDMKAAVFHQKTNRWVLDLHFVYFLKAIFNYRILVLTLPSLPKPGLCFSF
jgi:hypothetical protein